MKTIGVFAGSFNPWHEGHQNILDQSKEIFNKVMVIRGLNPGKLLHEDFGFKDISFTYRGLLTDALELIEKENKKSKIILIRGIRDIKDLQYEEEQLYWLRQLKPDLKHVFILCDNKYRFISSSAIRTLNNYKK